MHEKKKPQKKITLTETRKRNLLIACFESKNCHVTLNVKPIKDNPSKNTYDLTMSGIDNMVHYTDIDMCKNFELQFIRANVVGNKLFVRFEGVNNNE